MSSKARPWTWEQVRGFELMQCCRGRHDGLPVFKYGSANRRVLATRTQLRSMGLRPAGQDPAGLLWYRHRRSGHWNLDALYVIAEARPNRYRMTPAKWAALERANAARRVCPECGEDSGPYIRPTVGMCEACQYTRGLWSPWDDRHALVTGTPVIDLSTSTPPPPEAVATPSDATADVMTGRFGSASGRTRAA